MKHSFGLPGVIVCVVTFTSGCAPGSIADRGRRGNDDSGRGGEVDAKLWPVGEREGGGQRAEASNPDDASLGPSRRDVAGEALTGGATSAGGAGGSDETASHGGTGSGGHEGPAGAGGRPGGPSDAMGVDVASPDGSSEPADVMRPGDGANAANAWSGRWAGEFRFTVDSVKDPVNDVPLIGRSWALAMGVDEFAAGESADGWWFVGGRLASSDCLLTGALNAMVFVGDSISFVSAPLFIGSAGGVDRSGQAVAVTLAGERHGDSITGKISFESQHPLAAFCDERQLEFSLFRAR